MPEMVFKIRWPDGAAEDCYSPSLVIKEFLAVGQNYPMTSFLSRSREALTIASQRVEAKYGFPCSRASAQLARIERVALRFADSADATVSIVGFVP